MATLTVGPTKQYATIAAAVAAAQNGDTVSVTTGTYLNDVATTRSRISLVSSGGLVTVLGTQALASGTGLLNVTTDATVDGFVFAGAQAADGSAAGIVSTGGALTVRNSLFTNDQSGLVATANPTATVVITGSEFAGNGSSAPLSGNVVAGAIAALSIGGSYIHDAAGSDEVRSLARSTTVTGSRILDNAGAALASLALPNGGTVAIGTTVIEKGAAATGPAIRFGGGTVASGSTLSVTNSTLVDDGDPAPLLTNTTTTTASLAGTTLFGFTAAPIGPIGQSGTTTPSVRPTLATTSLVAPAFALPREAGRGGAVVANGTVLLVGGTGPYTTLAAALAAAHDGDTIRLAAGTYVTDSLTISHRVIVQGAGGLAHLVPVAQPTGSAALLTVTTDATLLNLEISGAQTVAGLTAAVHATGGSLTLQNSWIHDNQAGIVADGSGTVSVYDTEVARNGTADGRGANVDVAEIGTLTLRNAWVHDAVAGPEVRSRADATVIDASRISQLAGNGAADVELPNGGRAAIGGSALEKGANSAAGPLVHVGGGTLYAGSAVAITGTTLVSDLPGATPFVSAATAGIVTVTGSSFVGGAAGSVPAVNAAVVGATTKTGVTVNAAAPWGAMTAPAAAPPLLTAVPAAPTPVNGVLQLRVSEDAYQGDAQYTVTVDGTQVGDAQTATAVHGAGQTQLVTVAGQYVPGPHAVQVGLVNNLGGTDGSRNLYVDGMTFNGVSAGATASLTANGTALFTTAPTSTPTAVVVDLSEAAAGGDAQAFISIDGVVQGGAQLVTASHAAGQTQAMSFLLNLAPGPHTASVALLNAATGRSLYVDEIDVAGQRYPGAAATLGGAGAGSSTFAFTLPPPPTANASLFLTNGLPQLVSLLPPLH